MAPVLTHMAFHVQDVEGMIDFYQDFCQMKVVHDRRPSKGGRVVWIAEESRASELIFVLISGGSRSPVDEGNYSHLGFALESREAVDAVAIRGKKAGILAWEPCEEPYPVGYYCALRDPEGNFVEFSFGQPLGPGAPPGGKS